MVRAALYLSVLTPGGGFEVSSSGDEYFTPSFAIHPATTSRIFATLLADALFALVAGVTDLELEAVSCDFDAAAVCFSYL